MSTVLAYVVEAPGQMRPREFPRPVIGPDDVLVRVERVSVCGSDPAHYRGERLNPVFPIILGHEVVGRVEEAGGAAARHYGVGQGDRVVVEPYLLCGRCWYCLNGYYQLCTERRCYGVTLSCAEPPHLWGAYGEFLFVGPGSRLHRVDSSVPAEAACLASVLGNGFRWIKVKAQVQWGESVVIIGAGAQGLVTTVVAKESGAHPIMMLGLSQDAPRFALARLFGATHTIDVQAADPLEVVRDICGGPADVVIECSGSRQALDLAVRLLKPLGRCVLAGFPGRQSVDVFTEMIVRKELQILGGLGQAWSMEDAVRLINSQRYPIEHIITHTFPLQQAVEAIEFFISRTDNCTRVAIVPE